MRWLRTKRASALGVFSKVSSSGLRRRGRRIAAVIVFLVWSYPQRVESKFLELVSTLSAQGQVVVVHGSRCLGKPSETIRVFPILQSWRTGRYPWGPNRYLSTAYWHGYWFNYCKIFRVGSVELLAYWSMREGRWHVGKFVSATRGLRWECLSGTCSDALHERLPNSARLDPMRFGK